MFLMISYVSKHVLDCVTFKIAPDVMEINFFFFLTNCLPLTVAKSHCKMNYWNEKSNEDDDFFEQASLVGALMGEYAVKHLCKEPCRTSEDKDITLDHDDYCRPANLDSSQNLNIASSSEMNHVQDSVRDQIIELKK